MTKKMKDKNTLLELLYRLWPHISTRRRKQFIFLFVLMIIASFAEVLTIGAILPFLAVLTAPEQLLDNDIAKLILKIFSLSTTDELLLPLTLIFIFFAVFSGLSRLLLLWVQIRLSYRIGADLSLKIYRLSLYQQYAVHLNRNSSELIAGISSKADTVVGSAILPVMVLSSSVLMLLMIVTTLVAIEPVAACSAIFGFGLIYGLVAFFTRKMLINNSKLMNRETSQVLKAVQEGLGGIRDVLIDGTQELYCKIYTKADTPLRNARANIQIISNSPRFVIEALAMVLISVLAYLLAIRSEGIASAIPLLGALTLGAQRILPIIQQCFQTWSGMKGGQATLIDALSLLEQPMPDYVNKPKTLPIAFEKSIELDHINFCYNSFGEKVLKDLSLTITKGSRIGFIGTTGSGKSTLLDIVMGLLEPTQGCLKVDGIKITEVNQRSWQHYIAHVPQTIFLADTSIAENIAFGISFEDIDEQRLMRAAELAQLTQMIEKLPDQYNTKVGERGVRLSGGQRQRIGIARALYKNANVIVFDEATSALDSETEGAVMSAIEYLSKELTIIIVAHRLTTLKNCTQIYEISKGEIVRSGTYDDLFQM